MRADQMPKPWPPSEPELLPCPFCWISPAIVIGPSMFGTWYVHCPSCNADGPECWGESESVAKWNCRSNEEQP